MRSHRFFADIKLENNTTAKLPSEVSHHCVQVLRYNVGDSLTLFNGDGFDYSAKIVELNKKACQVTIESKSKNHSESKLKIHIYQSIAKGDKMDWLLQKSVELGVVSVTPVLSERSNVKLDAKRLEKKIQHWQKVVISACEQSGRAVIPKVHTPIRFDQYKPQSEFALYLHPQASNSISNIGKAESIDILIGPEGGFSDLEISDFNQRQFTDINLGKRILRTETASLAIISILQNLYGDLS
ncbi:MAG: 16S rRNA (uracil(1498)-N(3))-methyltransferase [Gammaproteobacteria bacterium]|nr:16S rRNA (uracil(1498)-N(3))-methyltransferase [Gammaproteobacteria bacterium]